MSVTHHQTTRPRAVGRRRLTALIAVALVTTFGLAACGGEPEEPADPVTSAPPSAASGPQSGGNLVWAVEVNLQTVNPHRNGQAKANHLLRNVFQPLFHLTEAGTVEPWIAESLDVSDDFLTYTVHLRDDVTFSDGAPLDADAVVLNVAKLQDTAYVTRPSTAFAALTSYEATDPATVVFTLANPDALFLGFLTGTPLLSPATFDLPQDTLEAGGPELAGIGPYTITSFVSGTELILTKRDDFHWLPASLSPGNPGPAYLDTVTYRTFAEGSTRTGSLEQGQVDVASDIQPLDVAVFETNSNFTYTRSFLSGSPYAYYFNTAKTPLDDVRVREAFTIGADYDAILNSIYSGAYERAWSPLSAVGPWIDSALVGWAKTDVERANALLDEAGWTQRDSDGYRTKAGERLRVTVETAAPFVRESREQLAVAISAALKQNLGLDFLYELQDIGTSTALMDEGKYEIFDNSYGSPDPAGALDVLYYSSDRSRGGIAYGNLNDATLEGWIDEARFTNDLNLRIATYKEIQNYITDNFFTLPIYQTQDTYAANTTVHGLATDPGSGSPLGAYTVWLEQ